MLNGNGTVTFTPNGQLQRRGELQLHRRATAPATSDAATVTVNVAAVNDAPVAVADTLAATEDTPVTYTAAQLLGNDTDVDSANAALSIASVTSGAGGTAVLNGDGTVTFTPNANFNGAASFTYTVDATARRPAPRDGDGQRRGGQRCAGCGRRHAGGDRRHAGHLYRGELLGNDTDVDSATLHCRSPR